MAPWQPCSSSTDAPPFAITASSAAAEVRRGFEAVVHNPKLRLMDQVREVLRLKHYAVRAVEGHASGRFSSVFICN